MANALKLPRFIYNKNLCSDVFDANGVMHASMQNALMMMAYEFINYMQKIGVDTQCIKVTDIYIHGSICNYHYDTRSDIDMVIVLDVMKLRARMGKMPVGPLIAGVYRAWRNTTKFSIAGRAVDITILDKHDDNLTDGYEFFGGIYSVYKNKWILRPTRVNECDVLRLRWDAFREFMKIRAMYDRIIKRRYDNDFIVDYLQYVWRRRRLAYRTVGHDAITMGYSMARRAGIIGELMAQRSLAEQITPILTRTIIIDKELIDD